MVGGGTSLPNNLFSLWMADNDLPNYQLGIYIYSGIHKKASEGIIKEIAHPDIYVYSEVTLLEKKIEVRTDIVT